MTAVPDLSLAGGLLPTRYALHALSGAWSLCCQSADHRSEPGGDQFPGDGDWTAIAGASTVAYALQQAGQWSLDSMPRDFDANTWWFRAKFDKPEQSEQYRGLDAESRLVFDGLATVCRVWFNGQPVLDSDNMFVQHFVNVDVHLKAIGNVLLLRFEALQNTLKLKRARPRWRTPMVAKQQLRWTRTTLLGRTPGWSPPAAAVGPWRPIWLEERRPAQLIRSSVRSSLHRGVKGDEGQLTVACWFQGVLDKEDEVTVVVEGLHGDTHGCIEDRREGCVEVALHAAGQNHGQIDIRLPQVALWWPHTHGTPALYQVSLKIQSATGAAKVAVLGRVGFRTMTRDSSNGGFALQVNQTAVFCRGACWMPLDVVSLRADASAYRQALMQVRDAGMNMLRLAGSTIYEDTVFFDLCDELGILVWQDLMFSNMDYPAGDAAFMRSVEIEVTQQMTRLETHPSVAVVCGNSEVEQQAAMWGAGRADWSPALFHDTLAGMASRLLGHAVYWPSSAHGGAFPHQPDTGTCSYYGVGAYKRALSDALVSQVSFATECLAFANIPPASTLRRSPAGELPQVHSAAWKSRVYRDLSVGWDFDDVREHYVECLLGLRPDELRAVDPARHLELGRAVAAEVMGRTMAAWRTAASRCGGALVWFLRDLWAGAGCGLVDDQGTPKSVLHALSRVQQPLLAVIEDRGMNGLVLHLVNETAEPVAGQVELVLYQHGETVVAAQTRAVQVAPRSQGQWALTDWLDGFMDLNWAYRFGPAAADLIVATWRDDQGTEVGRAMHFAPAQLIHFNGDPGLTAQAQMRPDGKMAVKLKTCAVAYGVHFESRAWQASDDFFHMSPGAEKTVTFSPLNAGQTHWHAQASALNARQSSAIPQSAVPV